MASEANPVIRKATDILTAMSRDEEARLKYEAREEFLFDQQYTLQATKRGGIEMEKHETARDLYTAGMDYEFIRKKPVLSHRDQKGSGPINSHLDYFFKTPTHISPLSSIQ